MKKIAVMFIIGIVLAGCISEEEPEKTEVPVETPETPPGPPGETTSPEIVVEQGFAPYKPYTVNVTPHTEEYKFTPDNMENFYLTEDQKSLLKENGFVIIPGQSKQFYEEYKQCKESNTPIFVTTDSILHTYHILYDYTLRIVETGRFIGDLETLTHSMIDASMEQCNSSEGKIKEAARKNVAFFAVAMKLLDPGYEVPSIVEEEVNKELSLIKQHKGFVSSPIFGYREDYSQYVPRGHYTRSEELKRYFKAMMWYGRIMFRLKPGKTQEAIEQGREETRQAILIVSSMNEEDMELWDRIYEPTVFFVGKTDDLNVYEYKAIIQKVYGELVGDINAKLDKFIAVAQQYRDPRINSSFVYDTENHEDVTKGLRFMGQRFIPDSYMFQQLVYDKVLQYTGSGKPFTLVPSQAGPIRGFPRGLDVLAVLGSEEALDILEEEGDTEYIKYDEQMEKLRTEFSSLTEKDWTQNLYWNWLYSLLPLLEEKKEGYPAFMQNSAWARKQLFTGLGSWTELRHDTILYAKQSYTYAATAMPTQPELTKGYVEPQPHLYARLASLAKMTREGLEERGLLLDEYRTKLEDLEELLLTLATISEKELENKPLTREEYETIWNIGETLEKLCTFEKAVESETDKSVEVIADVHTDTNSGRVLEEGVGRVFRVLAVVNVEERTYITEGPVFSYYEFKQPMDDRLTD
ncbi:MAG: DUF3160 domain-containing protein, partial [Euryarchaeota archaeon]|nr:DUF3160 domain-containing protein [Euryarchaeota archaeon]